MIEGGGAFTELSKGGGVACRGSVKNFFLERSATQKYFTP